MSTESDSTTNHYSKRDTAHGAKGSILQTTIVDLS